MVFIFLIVFIVISIILMKVKIEIENFRFSSERSRHINKDYVGKLTIYLLRFIPIFKIKVTKKRLEKINLKNQIQKININKKIDTKTLKLMKIIKPKIKKLDLNIILGTENAAITAFITASLKMILINLFKRNIEVEPVFNNKNQLNIYFEGIFEINLIHIINTLYIYNKKRRVNKNERTSNRRAYAYSNE